MALIPKVRPGRVDRMGPIVVPRDVFEVVVSYDGWATEAPASLPVSRQPYLDSIKYWMDENGACVVRNQSTGQYAAIKNLTQCATILPGNVLKTEPVIEEPQV